MSSHECPDGICSVPPVGRSNPLTVPAEKKDEYVKNYAKATKESGKLFLFAGDQKIEHLNKDFFGKEIPPECNDPEHLFKIAQKSEIGVFATQLGLLAQYGECYRDVTYVVKLNSKTDIVSVKQKDPKSLAFHFIDDVVEFKNRSGLSIVGVGYTVYLGSEYEAEMLQEAAQIVYEAHQQGLLVILWMYPRGKAIKDECDPDLIAGASGVGASLGADFVKINQPSGKTSRERAQNLQQAVGAAGKTKVLCSGGKKVNDDDFLQALQDQIAVGGAQGCAVGRNIHQRTLDDAVNFCKKIAEIVYKKKEA